MLTRLRCARRLLLAITILLIFGLPDTRYADAMTINIVSFDASRSYRPISDDYTGFPGGDDPLPPPIFPPLPEPDPSVYQSLRTQLLDPANFGAGGVVPHDINFLPDIADARGSALDGVDVLIVPEVRRLGTTNSRGAGGAPIFDNVGDPIAAAQEAAAIADFVRRGGCLVITADTGNVRVQLPVEQDGQLVANDILSALDSNSGVAGRITTALDAVDFDDEGLGVGQFLPVVGTSAILDGPFAYTSQLDPNDGLTIHPADTFSASKHVIINPGAANVIVGERNENEILLEILPDTINPGGGIIDHGPVLIASDTLFNDFVSTPITAPDALGGINGSDNNIRILMNFIGYYATFHDREPPPGNTIPEPNAAILAIFGIAMLALRRRRRTRAA